MPTPTKTNYNFAGWYTTAFYNCSALISLTFSDTTTWYRTSSSSNWTNKSGGIQTDVLNASTNVTYFSKTSGYYNYYWYKLN